MTRHVASGATISHYSRIASKISVLSRTVPYRRVLQHRRLRDLAVGQIDREVDRAVLEGRLPEQRIDPPRIENGPGRHHAAKPLFVLRRHLRNPLHHEHHRSLCPPAPRSRRAHVSANRPVGDVDRHAPGTGIPRPSRVVAGGRRLKAMQALVGNGVLDAEHPVPCLVKSGDVEPGEISLAENVIRIAMHPADQVVAFPALQSG